MGLQLRSDSNPVTLDFRQLHYTVAEVAEMWSLSPDAARRLFESESGALVLGGNGSRGARKRYTGNMKLSTKGLSGNN